MKFLVSIPAALSADGKWTTRREPVVPCFPSQHAKAFLAIPSFTLAEKAIVEETDSDPDELVDSMAKEYPSLPRKLHENYVMSVFKSVFDAAVGTVFSVAVTQKQAFLIEEKTRNTIPLWNEQPLT